MQRTLAALFVVGTDTDDERDQTEVDEQQKRQSDGRREGVDDGTGGCLTNSYCQRVPGGR